VEIWRSHLGFEQSLTARKAESIVGLPRGWGGGEILSEGAPWVRHEPAE
jgi:hypothetical protein